LIDYVQLLALGAFAGFTIFLGFPLAIAQGASSRMKGLLNATAIGILVFLIVDVLEHAWESVSDAVSVALAGKSSPEVAVLDFLAMFGGLAIGLLGLAWYGGRYMNGTPRAQRSNGKTSATKKESQVMRQVDAYRLSIMIAVGVGVHNFSEGLVIGQSYVSGAMGLAVILIIGFAAHNATEGFGIVGPLTGLERRPNIRFLIGAGLLGGGPTFVGTLLGSRWTSAPLYILFLAVAGGALIYVSMLMYNTGRKQTTNDVLMVGLFVGLFAGFVTDMIVTLGVV
jgi:ZIP family zinc transporter